MSYSSVRPKNTWKHFHISTLFFFLFNLTKMANFNRILSTNLEKSIYKFVDIFFIIKYRQIILHSSFFSGRYDIKIYHTFFQLHGKTFDYKIPIGTVLRLFLLPHKDGRQTYFVVSLDPPIKQGQTRYHFLVCLFANDEETSVELPFSE